MTRTSQWLPVTAVLVAFGAGGCDTNAPPVCDSLAAVQHSMGQVRHANVAENGLSQLEADLHELKANVQQLSVDAKSQFVSETDMLKTAISLFSASLDIARNVPGLDNLMGLRAALNGVAASARSLSDAMSGTC